MKTAKGVVKLIWTKRTVSGLEYQIDQNSVYFCQMWYVLDIIILTLLAFVRTNAFITPAQMYFKDRAYKLFPHLKVQFLSRIQMYGVSKVSHLCTLSHRRPITYQSDIATIFVTS